MFINLHTHDAKGSLLDAIQTVEQMVEHTKKNNQTALGLTNHGKMSSFVDFVKACNKNNIKPLIGNEMYEVDNMFEKQDTKEYHQQRYHLVLFAKTKQGLINLFKITSDACTLGFYKKPRVSIDYIKENNLGEGIILFYVVKVGRVSRWLTSGVENKIVYEYYSSLESIFDNVFCEIQSHSTDSQKEANKKIYDFINEYNLPYVITTDAHMISKDQINSHAVFVKISEDREVGESYVDCYLQTEQDVYDILENQFDKEFIKKGIEQTVNIADMIENIDIGLNKGVIMPQVRIQEGFDSNEEYLKYLVYKDFDKKFSNMSTQDQKIRKERIEIELPVLFALNYTDYFIMLYMLAQEANKRGIPRGYSRGSGANCLCLYMLGVTQVDSIKWDLDFTRFANLGRKSVGDFDWDISKRRRKEFVEISEELFGKDNVAPIATFNSLSTKVAIKDIGKVLDEDINGEYYKKIPYKMRDEIAKMIPTIKTINDLGEEEEKEFLLKDILFKTKRLKDIYEQYPLWFKYVMELEGLPKSMGRHAAGTLLTPKPIIEYCPICYDSDGNKMIQLEMHSAMDDLGLTKMDYLGLETVDIIDDTLKMEGLTWDDVDINNLNLSDKKVFDTIYKTGNTVGIFQCESSEAKKMCIEAEIEDVEGICVVNAANRPGTKDSFPVYCFNKKNPDKIEILHDDLKKIFEKTQFVLLYQEQALQIFRYAGFPENDVDNARRAIGHKEKETMQKLYVKFYEGLKEKNWTENQIQEIWNLMSKQAEYCFNRGHSISYSLLSYLTAYLKTHYTLSFMTSCLSSKSDNVSKLGVFINECQRLNIKVSPPSVNYSSKEFGTIPTKNEILFGLKAIKGLGDSVVETIINNRPYKNFDDFYDRNKNDGKIDKGNVIALAKSGAFPTKNKRDFLIKYAEKLFDSSFNFREYKDVISLPTQKELKEKWGIDSSVIKDKDEKLRIYNRKKKIQFDIEMQNNHKTKKEQFINDFIDKYLKDEYMWEFETLSMFLTKNPLKEASKYITPWEDVENGIEATTICIVVDIKRKKDKNGNAFVYIDLYTPSGMIECTCWSSQYKKYQDLIKKGNSLAIFGRKNNEQLFVKLMKGFNEWLEEKELSERN